MTVHPSTETSRHEKALAFENVAVLRNGLEVTHDVTFSVPAGQVTALIGPNGAGKSSLVLAASGGVESNGSIRFGDTELIGRPSDEIRRLGVAAVPEGHHILAGMSVADNLAAAASSFPRDEINDRVDEALTVLPELKRVINQMGGTLSGGQQQMVAFGQGLVCRPRAFIVDELSLGLAPIVVDRLLKVLSLLAETGTAVLLIEQFTAKALAIATSAHVISSGRLSYSGGVRPLLEDPDIIHSAYLGAGTST